ncbi:MAG: hypothetical protein ACK5Q4_03645 [Phycisphaerae bacterium]|jgi:hypothetical protein
MSTDPLDKALQEMHDLYAADSTKAVRGQGFIKTLHGYVAGQIKARLTGEARRAGVTVEEEATIFGSHKPKDVDVSVIHPKNGPLMIIGLRSQMSSVGKNALTYYQDIVGECISLQDRFPLAVIGYVYLHPLRSIKADHEDVVIDHARYAKMYNAISGRSGHDYKSLRGIYDQFAYMVVDFSKSPPTIDDTIVKAAVPQTDLSVRTFVDRMIQTYKDRNLFLDYFA